jgi:hypothetical protein
MIKQKDTCRNRFSSEKWFLTITDSLLVISCRNRFSLLISFASAHDAKVQACYVFQSSLTPLDNGEANQGPPSPKEKPEQSCNTENKKDLEQLKSDSNECTEFPDAKLKESSDVDVVALLVHGNNSISLVVFNYATPLS